MVEFFNENIHSFWFAVGFLLLIIEALALGFSVGFVMFIGLGALLTGSVIWFGLVPATWLASIATFAVSSVLVSAALWGPMRKIQQSSKPLSKDNTSDIIGLKFRLDSDLSTVAPCTTHYSGVEWQVEIGLGVEAKTISAGTTVVVVSVDAGKFWVAPVG